MVQPEYIGMFLFKRSQLGQCISIPSLFNGGENSGMQFDGPDHQLPMPQGMPMPEGTQMPQGAPMPQGGQMPPETPLPDSGP